jgi:hypothetical protein
MALLEDAKKPLRKAPKKGKKHLDDDDDGESDGSAYEVSDSD